MTPEALCKSGSEFGEQSALFCWANSAECRREFPALFRPSDGRLKLYSINNNAGVSGDKKTAAIRGAKAKQIGLAPGVADIFLPLARHGMHGLYIELKLDPEHPENIKRKKRGDQSPAQAKFEAQVNADGFGYCVCDGWKMARRVLVQYLS